MVEGGGSEVFLKKDNQCLEKKQADFDWFHIYSPLRLKKLLFVYVRFSDLVIFSFDNHRFLFCFSQRE